MHRRGRRATSKGRGKSGNGNKGSDACLWMHKGGKGQGRAYKISNQIKDGGDAGGDNAFLIAYGGSEKGQWICSKSGAMYPGTERISTHTCAEKEKEDQRGGSHMGEGGGGMKYSLEGGSLG